MTIKKRKPMTNEMLKAKVTTMEKDIQEIKSEVKGLPDQVAAKLDATMDLKIKLAITEMERKYQAKFISMLLAIISEGIGLAFAFLKMMR